MKATVYGIQRKVHWIYKDQEGYNQRLHIMYPDQLTGDDEGYRVEAIKIPLKIDLSSIHPGNEVEIYFNRFGAVESVVRA